MQRKTDPEAMELRFEQEKDFVNLTKGEFFWMRWSDYAIFPEGTIADTTSMFGESRFVWRSSKGGFDPRTRVIAPIGKMAAYHLPKAEAPVLLEEALSCENQEDVLRVVKKWGCLRANWKEGYSPGSIVCDTLSEWIEFIAEAKVLLELLEGKDSLEHVSISIKENGIILEYCVPGGKAFHLIPFVGALNELEATKYCIAHILGKAMKKVAIEKRYAVLPGEQIIEKPIPNDLYSFIWLMLEETALNKTESQAELRLKKCSICGDWDLEESSLTSDPKRRMRKRKGEDVWYHDACNRRVNRRAELERKSKSQGKTISPRPGARKDKVVLSSAAFLE